MWSLDSLMEAQDEKKDLNFSQFQFLLYIFNGLIDVDKNISPSSGNGRKSFLCNFLMLGKQKLKPDDKKAFFAVSSANYAKFWAGKISPAGIRN